MAKVVHYPYIDALRGLAFLGVLLVHVQQETQDLSPRLATAASRGAMGVQLFFVVSAFTLISSYRGRKKEEAFPAQNYFIRRIARIAPLFWCGLVFYGFLNGAGATMWDPNGVDWVNYLTALTFTHGFYPTNFNSVVPGGWSIAVEMLFYLVLPLIARYVTSLPRAVAATLGALGANLLLNAVLIHFAGPHWKGDWQFVFNFYTQSWFPQQLPVFLCGIVLYYLPHPSSTQPPDNKKAHLRSAFLIAVSLSIILAATYRIPPPYLTSQFLFAVAFVLLAWGLSICPWRLLVNPVTCYLGTISFSCYLTHFVMVYRIVPLIVARLPIHQPVALFSARCILTLLFTAACATLTYRFIELPGIALGRRLIGENEARAKKRLVLASLPAASSE